jgi:hypothetical protein
MRTWSDSVLNVKDFGSLLGGVHYGGGGGKAQARVLVN